MKKIAVATLLLANFAIPAFAADITPPPPPPPAAPSWSGCYVGVTLGGAFGRVNYNGVPNEPLGVLFPGLAAASTGTLDPKGVIAGGEGGCNLQVNQFVFGLETDFSGFGNFHTSKSAAFTREFTGPGFDVVTANTANTTASANWLFTLRPRVGFAFGNSLFYATGGLAVANFNFSQSVFFQNHFFLGQILLPPTTQNGSFNTSVPGWTVGGGFEYALSNNWSVKAEYLYVAFPNRSVVETDELFTPIVGTSQTTTANLKINIARLGVNYKF